MIGKSTVLAVFGLVLPPFRDNLPMCAGVFSGPACLEYTVIAILACPAHGSNIPLELELTDEYQHIALFTIIQYICNFVLKQHFYYLGNGVGNIINLSFTLSCTGLIYPVH